MSSRERFPSLNALRTFEAAGRWGSFKLAADELCVSPGAVSRQIKSLEEELGVELFDRRHREVILTESGRLYLSYLSDAFDRVGQGTKALLGSIVVQRLNIFCSMTLTMRWLVPRLKRYHAANPTRVLCLHTPIPTPENLRVSRTSLALRMCDEDWEDTSNTRLFDIRMVPVCSPDLLADRGRFADLESLKHNTLLMSLARPNDWAHWSAAAGVELDMNSMLQFESSSLAYEAAINGIGIAIGQFALVKDDLLSGRLVPAVDLVYCDGSYVCLASRTDFVTSPLFREFKNWIIEEAELSVAEETALLQDLGLKTIRSA